MKVAKSQLKVNQKAMDIQCIVCKATFLKTTRAPAYVTEFCCDNPIMPEMLTVFIRLTEHATNKHSKDLKDCFPTFEEAPPKK